MSLRTLFQCRRPLVWALLFPLILWCVDARAFVKPDPQDEVKVSVRTVEVKGDIILITYELVAPADQEYEVSLVLMRENNSSFKIPVRSASGDLGTGKFAGTSRQVHWEFKKDYPAGLQGSGYYFEIIVTKISSGSNLLLYIGLGAAAIGGAVFALGAKKGGGGTTSPPTSQDLPSPPARPSN